MGGQTSRMARVQCGNVFLISGEDSVGGSSHDYRLVSLEQGQHRWPERNEFQAVISHARLKGVLHSMCCQSARNSKQSRRDRVDGVPHGCGLGTFGRLWCNEFQAFEGEPGGRNFARPRLGII